MELHSKSLLVDVTAVVLIFDCLLDVSMECQPCLGSFVLCSLARHLTVTVLLSSQLYIEPMEINKLWSNTLLPSRSILQQVSYMVCVLFCKEQHPQNDVA